MSQEGSKQLFWSDSRYKLMYVDAGKFYARTDFVQTILARSKRNLHTYHQRTTEEMWSLEFAIVG